VAQFRSTADILDEILQKAGEVTNGNSPFETLAVTYANKVHHAIIGGGNIFNLESDEPWVWARSRFPLVLEMLPAYITGTITCTQNDINVVFSAGSSTSLEGWHFQVNGKPTVYKIMQHTAAGTQAQLDSSFVDSSGTYNFRCFKLDYEIMPTYMYIDNFNDRIDFQETAATTLSTTLTHGAYTPSNLFSHVIARLGSVGTASYGGSYDSVLKQFNVTSSVSFKLLGGTGPNKRRSGLPLIGFDRTDYTGAQSYTSTYTPNQIARLIEPFKIFSFEGGEPFIYSSEPIKMQEDYPISQTNQRIPDRFVRLTEENDGAVWVRFNAYPREKTKVVMDWIPVPLDLQDNAASLPALPRGDVDTLIHGAAAYIAFDKEDTKFDGFLNLCKAGLEAMRKKNRALLFRTGETFGQQVPRADLDGQRRKFNFGYTVSGGSTNTTAESTQSMIQTTLAYGAFQTASTVSSVTARTLPANRTLFAVIVKHSQVFTGASITAVTLDLGISGDPTKFVNGFDVTQAVSASAQDSALVLYFPAVATAIEARLTSTGANLSALAQGSVDIYFQETIVT
jgi:hypothetical protein